MTTANVEHALNASDLMGILGIKHNNTLRLKIKEGKVPKPDIQTSIRHRLWFKASLRKAGLLPPDSEPTPA